MLDPIPYLRMSQRAADLDGEYSGLFHTETRSSQRIS